MREVSIRYLANLGLLIGQGLLLYGDISLGILIKLFSGVVILFYMSHYKMWDMVIVLSAFMLLDLSKLIQLKF